MSQLFDSLWAWIITSLRGHKVSSKSKVTALIFIFYFLHVDGFCHKPLPDAGNLVLYRFEWC